MPHDNDAWPGRTVDLLGMPLGVSGSLSSCEGYLSARIPAQTDSTNTSTRIRLIRVQATQVTQTISVFIATSNRCIPGPPTLLYEKKTTGGHKLSHKTPEQRLAGQGSIMNFCENIISLERA